MQKSQKVLAAALLAALVSTGGAASAADIYAGGGMKDAPIYVPLPTWTGFYLGANMGIAWTNLDLGRFDFVDSWGNSTSLGGGKLNSTNGFGGGQFGYNWQTANWVFGIEVDLGAVGINSRQNLTGETTWAGGTRLGRVVSLDMKDDDFRFAGDVTGRLGFTWGSTLVYAKGGFAFLQTDLAMRETVMDRFGNSTVFNGNNSDDFLTGWTVGGGLEWKVGPSWSIKAEYLHFDFSNLNANCCGDGINTWNNKHDLTSDTVKIGFNYFWNPPVAPLK